MAGFVLRASWLMLITAFAAGAASAQGLVCPAGMARIDDFCIDRWEAHLADASPFEVPTDGVAVSEAAVVPQGYISATVAATACAAAGKRLCTATEWTRACRGPTGTTYPYGDTYVAGACNDVRAEHPVVTLFGAGATFDAQQMNDPRLNQLPDTVEPTGAHAGCVSAEGVYDLHGNLNEWISDPNGTWKGGFYVEAVNNGAGCLYTTTAHPVSYHDFSTGFRCCTEPEAGPPVPMLSRTALFALCSGLCLVGWTGWRRVTHRGRSGNT